MNIELNLQKTVKKLYGKEIAGCSNEELYYSLLNVTKELIDETKPITGTKKVYYISAEFLIGKLLGNNLMNLGIYDDVAKVLKKHGRE